MGRFFSMDNKFFTFMGRIADLCILNLLCILCCIPVVTAGASLTALFYVTMKMVRNEEAYIVRGFFKSFKQNFRQATIINVIMLVAAVILWLDTRIIGGIEGSLGNVMRVIFALLTMFYLMVFLYVYPLLAKFYNTIKNTFRNAFLMGIRHLPFTFLMMVICASPVLIFFLPSLQAQMFLILLLLLLGPAVIAYCNSCFFVRIFDKYIPKEEAAEETEVSAQ